MARTVSPLRYPGGKASFYPIVSSLLRENKFERRRYAEPFAGGAGLALCLLYGGYVSDVHINDVDRSIWAFWHSVLNSTEEFTYMIANTPITVEEWRHQREIHREAIDDPLALGFSTFFLNRTNRSGIINRGGVIGGLGQRGKYKIDCRFNREDLIRRVRRVAKYRNRIHLTMMDALDFIEDIRSKLSSSLLFFIDPPYFKKGAELYTRFYDSSDHARLAKCIRSVKNPWILTYDDCTSISRLYRGCQQYRLSINYSLERKRYGTELMIVPRSIRMPQKEINVRVE